MLNKMREDKRRKESRQYQNNRYIECKYEIKDETKKH